VTIIPHDGQAVLSPIRVGYDPADDEFSALHDVLTSKDPALKAQGVELLMSMEGGPAVALDRYMAWRGWEVAGDYLEPGYALIAQVGDTRWGQKHQIPDLKAHTISGFLHIAGRVEVQMLETIGRALLPRWGGVRL